MLRAQLDEEVLSNLTWAFIATDLDHTGTIDPREMAALLSVLGGQLIDMHKIAGETQWTKHEDGGANTAWTEDKVREIMVEAKKKFKAYRRENNLQDVPDEYQYPSAFDASKSDSAGDNLKRVTVSRTATPALRHSPRAQLPRALSAVRDPAVTEFPPGMLQSNQQLEKPHVRKTASSRAACPLRC